MVDTIPQEKKSIELQHTSSAKACPKCPKCLSAQRTRRIPRPLWMRIFPNSMNMTCGQCGHRFWRIG